MAKMPVVKMTNGKNAIGKKYRFHYDQKSIFSLSYYITYNLIGPEEFIYICITVLFIST